MTAIGALLPAPFARADPLRLRGDAIAETQAPAGLLVLQGEDRVRNKTQTWVDAEGLVWAGADAQADVLVLSLRLRDPRGRGEARVGRFVFASGAIRPVQIDGASVLARAPWGSTIEAMGGMPVVPRFGARAYDWIAGGRAAQPIASRATIGVSYVQRRAHGEIADDEVGADFAARPAPWLDLAARSAYDLTSPGIADALTSAATRIDDVRLEAFATHRSPSRLLPATSLFSVLGDFPSDTAGATLRWYAAPRLDVWASGAAQDVAGALGGNASVRTLLKLDDRGEGNVGAEVRRQDVATARWTGVRLAFAQPFGARLRLSTELEIAAPDQPRGRGALWPWGLAALAWRSGTGWEAAAATEAAATPVHAFELNALVRVSRAWEVR
jgi:hypothetical protein